MNSENNFKTLGEESTIRKEIGKLNRSQTKSTHRETPTPQTMNKKGSITKHEHQNAINRNGKQMAGSTGWLGTSRETV